MHKTTGWLVIGSLLLAKLGLASAADLDSRALLGQHLSHLKVSRARTAGALQLAFALLALVVSIPLAFTTTSSSALSIAGIITSILAALTGLFSSRLVLFYVSRRNWPRGVNLRRFEHAWGISVATHCLCLVGAGLHVYFTAQVIYTCVKTSPPEKTDFRPNCDANVGVLAGILPYIMNGVALVMLGIASVITAIRVATLVEQLTHTTGRHLAAINLRSVDESVRDLLYTHDKGGGGKGGWGSM